MKWLKELNRKLDNGSAVIGIVGLGYVGLPLAVTFSRRFKVIGYDVNPQKIESLKQGRSYVEDVPDTTINHAKFHPTNKINELKEANFIIITVPTPLREDKTPDLSYVRDAARKVGGILQKGQFVILESTTYPGTTREVLVPILEQESGLKVIYDFGVAYSPERVDPGNKKYTIENTPKVVGGLIPEFTDVATKLYQTVIKEVIPVTDCKTAEAVKMLENIFRNVNIALVNELALIFEKMGIDIWEVIEAAKTKPYGFMAFYPGPGIGGHCIPLDPYYLAYKAKQHGIIPRFIETSGEINDYMPIHTVNLAVSGLSRVGKNIYNANVAILGLAYKADISDTRESPARRIIEELVERGANVRVYDPHAKSILTRAGMFNSEENLNELLDWADVIIITTDHKFFKEKLGEIITKTLNSSKYTTKVIIDGRNILKNCSKVLDPSKVIYMKIGGKQNQI